MEQSKFIEETDKLIALLSNYHNILEGNEAQTRWMLIDPFILDCWGYKREDIIVEYSVDKEERVSKYDALDYCVLLNNKPKLLIEAKSLGVDLYSKYSQLANYFKSVYNSSIYQQRELIGVLTDGDLYLFYTDSKEQGVLDTEPYLTVRLSIAEEYEIAKLLNHNKEGLLNTTAVLEHIEEDYDLSEYYRIDMIEKVFNSYKSRGLDLYIDSVYICGKLKKITSLRTLYREILKQVNILQPNLLYDLAVKEVSERVDGSISECIFSMSVISECIELNTKQGIIYGSMPRTRKGVIDRIVCVLQQSSIGLLNVLVKLKEE